MEADFESLFLMWISVIKDAAHGYKDEYLQMASNILCCGTVWDEYRSTIKAHSCTSLVYVNTSLLCTDLASHYLHVTHLTEHTFP